MLLLLLQIKSFDHESTLLAQRNAKQWLVHSYLFSTAKSNPEWKHIETTSSKQLVCKHNPAALFAAISSLAETYSITVTASFSHVSADADFPFVRASAFGGGESSLRLRKSPWHQSDISRFAVKLTMTDVKSNHVGSNPLLVRHGMSIHIRGLGLAIFESALIFIFQTIIIYPNNCIKQECDGDVCNSPRLAVQYCWKARVTSTASVVLLSISLSFVPPRSEEESPVSVFGSLPGSNPTYQDLQLS